VGRGHVRALINVNISRGFRQVGLQVFRVPFLGHFADASSCVLPQPLNLPAAVSRSSSDTSKPGSVRAFSAMRSSFVSTDSPLLRTDSVSSLRATICDPRKRGYAHRDNKKGTQLN